jgi:hypothetical protein
MGCLVGGNCFEGWIVMTHTPVLCHYELALLHRESEGPRENQTSSRGCIVMLPFFCRCSGDAFMGGVGSGLPFS